MSPVPKLVGHSAFNSRCFLSRACDRSRLRLAAACGFLKLAMCKVCRDLIPLPMFLRLALIVQVCKSHDIVGCNIL